MYLIPTDPAGAESAPSWTELQVRHANGSWRWHDVRVRNLLRDPSVGGLLASYRDITGRRALQQQLAHHVSHDALTGVLNRAEFVRRLEHAAGPAAGPHRTAVLRVDLAGLKEINGSLGHEAGDRALVAVAAALRRNVLSSDLIGRLGSDVFGIVLADVGSPQHAVALARRDTAPVSGPLLRPVVRIGIATSGPDGPAAADLLHRAGRAADAVRRRPGSGWQLSTADLPGQPVDSLVLENDLRLALERDELHVQYQPVVDLASGELDGLEALVRWDHPSHGRLPPDAFIAVAERTGLINRLGEWVLEAACSQTRRWQDRLAPRRRLTLNVNLSPHQLVQPTLVWDVLAILRRTGFDPHDLALEVTESALVEDDSAIPALTALTAQGIRIAVDDFGTGYSSLRYLVRLPVDILKIDRSFVNELNATPEGSAVAAAVVRLSQALGLDTVAEGIESDAQAAELAGLGCRTGQGYYFARPLDPAGVDALIDRIDADRMPVLWTAAVPASHRATA